MRSSRWLAIVLLAVGAPHAAPVEESTTAVEVPRYDVRAAVDVAARTIALHLIVDLPKSWSAPILWLYADRLRDVAPSFDEFEAERIYPNGVDRGGYETVTLTVQGCAPQQVDASTHSAPMPFERSTRGRDVEIDVCPTAVAPLHLVIDTTLRLPRRYGTLGVARDVMTLGDPWYPLLLESPGATVAPRADHTVRITTHAPQLVANAAGVSASDGTGAIAQFTQRGVTHAPAVMLPVDRATTLDRNASVQLTLVTDAAELQVRSPFDLDSESSLGAFEIDAAGLLHGTLRNCISLLRRLHYTAAPMDRPRVGGMSDTLVVVEVPERQRLAVAVPGMLLVSDHAFRVAPLDRVRRLHALPIARAAFAALLTPHERASTLPADVSWSPDLDGALLADRLLHDTASTEALGDPSAQSVKKEGTSELVKTFGFNRSVDSLLYAPRIAFGAALVQTIEEPDPDRTGADRARNAAPMGRFLLEKLRDRLDSQFGAAAAAHFGRGDDWRRAATATAGQDLSYFWNTWVEARRHVAYRLDQVTTTAVPEGSRTVVNLTRLGDVWIREPVVVQVTDVDGHGVRAWWDAAGAHGQVTITTPGEVANVRLDPDGRLSQDPTLTTGHPRFDDTLVHAWKPPVFGGFSAAYSETERRFDLDLSFVMRRQFDLDGGWAITATSGARGWGGSLQRVYDFGPKRDLNGRLGSFSLGLSALRSASGFGRQLTPLTQASIVASLSWDTVLQPVDPMTGYGGLVTLGLGLAREDTGGLFPTLEVSTRAHALFWEHIRTVSVLIVGAGAVVGDARDAQLLGLGGHTLLRAFEADQSLGRANAYAIFEQRWHAFEGAYLNAGNAAWIRALEIVPWVAGGVATSPDDITKVTTDGMLLETGIGLRLLTDWAGIQPGTVVFDVGVPLLRPDPFVRDASGNILRSRQRVGFWFGFVQIL
ncbi:MAG: hypothetical protein ACHREM_17050 [Polyangiales bacterium]